MKFIVSRASDYSDSDKPPCEGAIFERKDEETDEHFWSIEIKTLEELLEFTQKNQGKIILGLDPPWFINIYDYYVE